MITSCPSVTCTRTTRSPVPKAKRIRSARSSGGSGAPSAAMEDFSRSRCRPSHGSRPWLARIVSIKPTLVLDGITANTTFGPTFSGGRLLRRVATAALIVTAACGPKRPPPTFAPDPGLVEQIREIRMSTSTSACPGESFGATYTAVLKDGSFVPFETRYDKDQPPRLHVVFLQRWSNDATPLEAGGWSTTRDPLATAITGFRLNVALRAKPNIATSTVVTPEYSCMQHTFGFSGTGAGANGPQVTVSLGLLLAPVHERRPVAGIEVEDAP